MRHGVAFIVGIVIAALTTAAYAGPFGYCPTPVIYLNSANQLTYGLVASPSAPNCQNNVEQLYWVPGQVPSQVNGGMGGSYANPIPPTQTLTVTAGSGGVAASPLVSTPPSGLCSQLVGPVQLTLPAGGLQYNQTYSVNVPALTLFNAIVHAPSPWGGIQLGPGLNNCTSTTLAFSTPKAVASAMQFGERISAQFESWTGFSYNSPSSASILIQWFAPPSIAANGSYATYRPNPTYSVTITPQNNTQLPLPQKSAVTAQSSLTPAFYLTVSQLQPSTTYNVVVTATDPNATIPVLTKSFTTPKATLSFPNGYNALELINVGQHMLQFMWAPATGDYPSNIHYAVVVKSAAGRAVSAKVNVTQNGNYYYVTITGLQPNTQYKVAAVATDAFAENSPQTISNTAKTKTTLSGIANVKLTSNNYHQATLSWSPVKGDKPSHITYAVSVVSPNSAAITAVATAPGNNTASVINNVMPNTAYKFTITATDNNSVNTPTTTQTLSTPQTTLGTFSAPSFAQPISYDKGVLTWSSPSGDYPASVIYSATLSPNTNGEKIDVDSANTTATLSNLQADTSYSIYLTAKDSGASNSPVSFTQNIKTEKATLDPLSKLNVSSITMTSATISWNPVSGDATKNITYSVQVASAAGVAVPANAISIKNDSATVTGLMLDTQYNVTVNATDVDATKAVSATTSFNTAKTTLSFPSNIKITITNTTKNSATANWPNAQGDSQDEIQYHVFVSPNRNGEKATLNLGSDADHSASLSNLQPDTTYTVGVKATDSRASNTTPPVSQLFITKKTSLTSPGKPSVSDVTENSAQLSWTPAGGDAASDIQYQVSVQKGSDTPMTSTTSNTQFSVTGLQPNAKYTAIITATDTRAFAPAPSASASIATLPVVLQMSSSDVVVTHSKTTNTAMVTCSGASGDQNKNNITYNAAISPVVPLTPISEIGRGRPAYTAQISGLKSGTQYTLTITAQDPYALKPAVVQKIFTPIILTAPQVNITRITSNSAAATWVNATGDNTSTNITYTKSLSPTGVIKPLLFGGHQNGVLLSSLTPSTTYTFTVTATDSHASNSPVIVSKQFKTSPAPIVVKPIIAKPLVQVSPGASCAEIFWQPVKGAISYAIAGASYTAPSVSSNNKIMSFVYGLLPNTTHRITVYAKDLNAQNGGSSSTISFTTQQAPINNLHVIPGSTGARVTWSVPMNMIASPEMQYQVKVMSQQGVIQTSTWQRNNYAELTNLRPGTYTVSVSAVPSGFPAGCITAVSQPFVITHK